MVKLSEKLANFLNNENKVETFYENQEIELYIFIQFLEKFDLLKKREILYYVSK